MPDSVLLLPDERQKTFEVHAPTRCIGQRGGLCPEVDETVVSAQGGRGLPARVRVTVLRNTTHYVQDFRVEPDTVLRGSVARAVIELSCAAAPGGVTAGLSSDHEAVAPADVAPVVPEGERELHVDLLTSVVTAAAESTITLEYQGRVWERPLTVLPGSLDLTVREIEVTQGVQFLDHDVVPDNSLPLLSGKPVAVRVHLDANTAFPIDFVDVKLESRLCGVNAWVVHEPLWPHALVEAALPHEEQRESPLFPEGNPARTTPHKVSFLIPPERTAAGLGCLDFRAEVNPGRLFVEEDYENNALELKNVAFTGNDPAVLKFVQVDYCPGCPFDRTPRLVPEWETADPVLSYLQRMLPRRGGVLFPGPQAGEHHLALHPQGLPQGRDVEPRPPRARRDQDPDDRRLARNALLRDPPPGHRAHERCGVHEERSGLPPSRAAGGRRRRRHGPEERGRAARAGAQPRPAPRALRLSRRRGPRLAVQPPRRRHRPNRLRSRPRRRRSRHDARHHELLPSEMALALHVPRAVRDGRSASAASGPGPGCRCG